MDEEHRMDEKNELKELIKERGFTMGSLSKRTGISTQTIATYINHPKPSKKQTGSFTKLARALGVTEQDVRRMTGNELEKKHPILDVLNEKGMTMLQFAQESGVPYGTLRGIVSGNVKNPRRDTIGYIADTLDVDVERII